MNHKQALADYLKLKALAVGDPYDVGEILEGMAGQMFSRPTAREATEHLCYLIKLFYDRGDGEGNSIQHMPEANEIFVRHGLAQEQDD